MVKHFVVAVALGVTYYGVVVAETTRPTFKVGDWVALELSDDIAAKYARLKGITTDGLSLAILARVDRLSDDGMVRIQHSCEIRNNGKTILVKLTGTFPVEHRPLDFVQIALAPKGR